MTQWKKNKHSQTGLGRFLARHKDIVDQHDHPKRMQASAVEVVTLH